MKTIMVALKAVSLCVLFLALAPIANANTQLVHEDAEDGDIANWDVYDSDPAGAVISNVVDSPYSPNRVIQFEGEEKANGFRYTFPSPSTDEFIIQWKMKYSESYTIYISCQTTLGHRYIYYTSSSSNYLGAEEYVHHGLGVDSKSGQWVIIRRNLLQDLHDAQPENNIISVDAFLIRGNGRVDDIKTLSFIDTDNDLIPDDTELTVGLDADNPGDAQEDMDGDSLTNINETLYKTYVDKSDSDNDQLNDYFELFRSLTDPLATDTDSNGVTDDLEDPDEDEITNKQEQDGGTDPLLPAINGNGYKYELISRENAEDGDTKNWDVYDSDPEGAQIANVADPVNAGNQVIQLTGDTTKNGFRYIFEPSSRTQFKVRWRMNYAESYTIYLSCQTSLGHRYIYYTASSSNGTYSGDGYIHHGLGRNSKLGKWVTVLRDLQSDLHDAEPENKLISVNAFLVRGSGLIDDISTLAYADADHDLIPDALEDVLGLDPVSNDSNGDGVRDGDEDFDGDGLTNTQELNAKTDLDQVDTDGDGLTDSYEINKTHTDPTSTDSNNNGITDDQEDADGDSYTNIQEQTAGTDPMDPAIQGTGYLYEQTVQEDAEDGTTDSWDIFDNDPEGATITNVIDPADASKRVISFNGSGKSNGYRYKFQAPEYTQFKIQWRMKYNESYTIYISCQTTAGHRYVYYTASSSDSLGSGEFVHHGLGSNSKANRWITIRRDLQADLHEAQPSTDILSVEAFLIRGSGMVDDIKTLAYLDADSDLIPDELEITLGLDPADPADAVADLDGDGLSNLEETIFTSKLDNVDSDGDGLTDYFEILAANTNPNAADSDSNSTSDADEDLDADGLTNLQEQAAGMDPLKTALEGNGFKYEQTIHADAEDGTTENWDIYDSDPEGAVISNVEDPDDAANRVIQLTSTEQQNGFRCFFRPSERKQVKIQWKMKYAESYTVYISCQTTTGHRYIYYTASESNVLGSAEYVHHGLGSESKAGQWMTIRRDLQRDLWEAQPGCNIISVEAFLIRGSGYVDDITTIVYADADRDLIPDTVETAAGLNPNDPSDASADADEDGISNLNEFYDDTLMPESVDTDGDGLDDTWETQHGLDPNSIDSDGDGINDADEDDDQDFLTVLQEFQNGLNPTIPDGLEDQDDDDYLTVYEVVHASSWNDANSKPTPTIYVSATAPDGGNGSSQKPFSNIKDAINAATTYDIIMLTPGTYTGPKNSNIKNTKGIMLTSESGPDQAVIDFGLRWGFLHEFAEKPIAIANVKLVNATNMPCYARESGFVYLKNVAFIKNRASYGAGVFLSRTNGKMNNCLFVENEARWDGGCIYVYEGNLDITNCTFCKNESGEGRLSIYSQNSTLTITNSIIWGNVPNAISAGVVINNSCVEGGYAGDGNVDSDPKLSRMGYLTKDSPCIDAGIDFPSRVKDIQGEAIQNTADIGADEFVDTDDNTLPDFWEMLYFQNLNVNATEDGDCDKLNNYHEFILGLDPTKGDTDGDELADELEVNQTQTDPLLVDTDYDGMSDKFEIENSLNPLDPTDGNLDNDNDGYTNSFEGRNGSDINDSHSVPMPGIYVDVNAVEGGDGSKEFPFTNLGEALDASISFSIIQVAPGIYKGEKNRELSSNNTIIITSEKGPGVTIIDCENQSRFASIGSLIDQMSTIDGFTIKRTYKDYAIRVYGGLVIKKCVFSDIKTSQEFYWGGAINAYSQGTKIIVEDTRFQNMSFDQKGSIIGVQSTDLKMFNCDFSNNTFDASYGIVKSDSSSVLLRDCRFLNNTSINNYGYLRLNKSNIKIENCLFVNNKFHSYIFNFENNEAVNIANTTIASNTGRSGVLNSYGNDQVNLKNCVLWGNSSVALPDNLNISYSCVEGGYVGDGNIDSSPKLIYGGYLLGNSSVVDAGIDSDIPEVDFNGDPRWDHQTVTNNPTIVDMGAFEFKDEDGDNLPDSWELKSFDSLDYTLSDDPDGDGLTIEDEINRETDPANADTDSDGLNDGDEINIHNTDPLNSDSDDDGLNDGIEIANDLNPLDENDALADPDNDFYPNVYEILHGSNHNDSTSKPSVNIFVSCNATEDGDGSVAKPFNTIKKAINAARDYDVIQLSDGEYKGIDNKNLIIQKNLYIRSENGPHETIINSEGSDYSFNFRTTAQSSFYIDGITLTKCEAHVIMLDNDACATIMNCMIKENNLTSSGAIICSRNSMLKCVNTVFTLNNVPNYGGTVYCYYANASFVNCTFFKNTALSNGGTIYNKYSSTEFINCIMWNNATDEIFENSPASIQVTYSCIKGGYTGDGNIDSGPKLFADGFLFAGSPCIDAGTDVNVPAYDINGDAHYDDPTVINNPSIVDMGATEFKDTDNDSLPDTWEILTFGSLDDDLTTDSDGDGLTTQEEAEQGTDPAKADTDGDGISDYDEIHTHNTSPLNPDSDDDSVVDGTEVSHGLNPLDGNDVLIDHDDDTYLTIYEVIHGSDYQDVESVPDPTVFVDVNANSNGNGSKEAPYNALFYALRYSEEYDIVMVKAGEYKGWQNCNLIVNKNIYLLTEKGPFSTIINCENKSRAFSVYNNYRAFVINGICVKNSNDSAVRIYGNSISIYNCVFDSNIGQYSYPSVIDLYKGGYLMCKNCIFDNNRSRSSDGSVIKLAYDVTAEFINCTFINNKVTHYYKGGALYSAAGNAVSILNCIFWGNYPEQISGDVTTQYSCIEGGYTGEGNIDSDPLINIKWGLINTGSPCINSGSLANALKTDILGQVRINVPDMGAFEFVDTDSDSLLDSLEMKFFGNLDRDGSEDQDGDGISDYNEYIFGTTLNLADSDSDGLNDYLEIYEHKTDPLNPDSDNDKIPDGWEVKFKLDPLVDDASHDYDTEGLNNFEEYKNNTDPFNIDTDGDGYSDRLEVMNEANPNNSYDIPIKNITILPNEQLSIIPGEIGILKVKLSSDFISESEVINISHSSGNKNIKLVSSNSLTFTNANWNVEQVIEFECISNSDFCSELAFFKFTNSRFASKEIAIREVDSDFIINVESDVMGTVQPSGKQTVTQGQEMTVIATPNVGYHFVRWSGCVPQGKETDNPITFTADYPYDLYAEFAKDPVTHRTRIKVDERLYPWRQTALNSNGGWQSDLSLYAPANNNSVCYDDIQISTKDNSISLTEGFETNTVGAKPANWSFAFTDDNTVSVVDSPVLTGNRALAVSANALEQGLSYPATAYGDDSQVVINIHLPVVQTADQHAGAFYYNGTCVSYYSTQDNDYSIYLGTSSDKESAELITSGLTEGWHQIVLYADKFIDSDYDGMDDDWEIANFGNLDQDADGDFDNDRIANKQEFDDETDPKLANASVSFAAESTTSNEGQTEVNIEVTLSETATQPVSVEIGIGRAFAKPDQDYKITSPLGITFAPGETTKNVTVDVMADQVYNEGTENVTFILKNPKGANIGIQSNHTLYIMDSAGNNSDGDNLPDWWEMKYFGDLDEVDDGDPDNDGANNLTEYRQGRHPNAGVKTITPKDLNLKINLPGLQLSK